MMKRSCRCGCVLKGVESDKCVAVVIGVTHVSVYVNVLMLVLMCNQWYMKNEVVYVRE